MHRLKHISKQAFLVVTSFVLVGAAPLTAYAQEGGEKPESYTYDKATGRWNSDKWVYNAPTNTYIPAPPPPAPAPAPTPTTPAPTTPAPNPVTTETPKAAETQSGTQSTPTTDGGAKVESSQNMNDSTKIDNNSNIGNKLDSNAKSGDSAVTKNTKGGNATTGNASAETTVVNTVHSTVQGDTAGIAHFTADINGDVTGDIMLYPAINGATASSTTTVNSETGIKNTSNLKNDINLSATSGNALVNQNTEAGDATSGNANTVANVVNLINTIIAANKSFVGTINIYGNLDGDILISPEFIPQLLGSNASNAIDTSLSSSLNNNQQIINNIKLGAETGAANVSGNTSAGSAQTGDAATNLTVLNLTGREVNASNSLLVFVNVLGTWVGMIVDAPGATAAALGSGVIDNKTTINGELAVGNNETITNNITLASQSGNADVTENTQAGNAKTGNATASANIANISTSKFNLSDWFGVLFINVYGKWIGSFGVDTEAGNRVMALSGDAVPPRQEETALGSPGVRLGFIPKSAKSSPTLTSAQPMQTLASSESAPAGGSMPSMSQTEAEQVDEFIRKATAYSQPGTVKQEERAKSDMTNAIMMAIGSVVTLAGATTAVSGNKHGFFGRRNRN